ncbi:fructose PTS transporter subunit IIA [Companilactobacillus allii]|uniref:PTS cellobiose transporter subunit IIA n=1 Tax=Companilactobacillus allii TaxID=1847728 RepID=A0A1P8Q0L6_9LACO|nr:fructose PTS transporter subunit IIA [Companilactobacillus allii]APX71414.1 PTS cellobiose transporter subunit IIA [Companilactobacillus allii]USQ68494.1 fructose PTS transporter subunit IIA [Companilactobacillus allii]
METSIFNQEHIFYDHESKTQDEAFLNVAKFIENCGYVNSYEVFYQGLKAREIEATTGFKNGIAIPHSNDESVLEPGLFLVKFDNKIDWEALDGEPIQVGFFLTIPKDGAKEHLKLLSKIARKLMDDEFRENVLKNNDSKILTETIEGI